MKKLVTLCRFKAQPKIFEIMRSLTPAEKAALYYQVLENVQDWKIIYRIAIGEKHANTLKQSTIQANTSKWKESDRIRDAVDEIKRYFYFKRQELEKEIIDNISSGETEATKEGRKNDFVNLLDRDTFLEEINKGANSAKDEKDKREYLKMISDNLRYKDTERDENNEIQRFYTPITCENCEIYKRCKGCKLSNCPEML